jgi:hypothetical protein
MKGAAGCGQRMDGRLLVGKNGGMEDEGFLGGGPGEEAALPGGNQVGVFVRKVEAFFGVGFEVEELGARGVEAGDEFPFSVAHAGEWQPVIGEEKGGTRSGTKEGGALILGRWGESEQVEDGWGEIDEAGDSVHAPRLVVCAGHGDEERDAHVFFVHEKGVAEIGFVLAEGFAVIAVDDEERVGVEAAPAEGFEERAEGGVAVMKGVEVLRGFFGVGKRTRLGSGVGMMTGDGEIMDEETLLRWK